MNGFEPIVMGDKIVNNLLMTESEKKKCLFEIKSLEYDPKYCCRLKSSNTFNQRNVQIEKVNPSEFSKNSC
jgi:hypothetical protein